MNERFDMVQPGWEIVGSDDQRIGEVGDVGDNYLHLTQGLIFPKDVYVPTDAIARIDPDQEQVRLNVAKSEIDHLKWDTIPEDRSTLDASRVDQTGFYQTDDATQRGGYERGGYESGDVRGEETTRVPVVEEELRAQRRSVDAGEVEVRRGVREEERTLDVPVTREEVDVRRRKVDRPAGEGDRIVETDDTLTVPVRSETVEVTKEPRVVEEIEISKRPVTETQRVTDTVRREEVDVRGRGEARVRDEDEPEH